VCTKINLGWKGLSVLNPAHTLTTYIYAREYARTYVRTQDGL